MSWTKRDGASEKSSMLSGHHMWEKLREQLQARKEAEMEQKPP